MKDIFTYMAGISLSFIISYFLFEIIMKIKGKEGSSYADKERRISNTTFIIGFIITIIIVVII